MRGLLRPCGLEYFVLELDECTFAIGLWDESDSEFVEIVVEVVVVVVVVVVCVSVCLGEEQKNTEEKQPYDIPSTQLSLLLMIGAI